MFKKYSAKNYLALEKLEKCDQRIFFLIKIFALQSFLNISNLNLLAIFSWGYTWVKADNNFNQELSLVFILVSNTRQETDL